MEIQVSRLIVWGVLALWAAFTLGTCMNPAYARDIIPVECGIERELHEDNEVGRQLYNFPPSQEYWVAVSYDTNKDIHPADDHATRIRKIDALTWTYPGAKHPEFYFFDRDFDGDVDIVYRDRLQNGSCWGIEVAWTPATGLSFDEWLETRAYHVPPGKES